MCSNVVVDRVSPSMSRREVIAFSSNGQLFSTAGSSRVLELVVHSLVPGSVDAVRWVRGVHGLVQGC